MGENKNTYKVLVEEAEGKYLSEDLDTAGRIIILKRILKVEGRGSDSYGTSTDFCEQGNQLSGSVNCEGFF
jgi:hypothetical protein